MPTPEPHSIGFCPNLPQRVIRCAPIRVHVVEYFCRSLKCYSLKRLRLFARALYSRPWPVHFAAFSHRVTAGPGRPWSFRRPSVQASRNKTSRNEICARTSHKRTGDWGVNRPRQVSTCRRSAAAPPGRTPEAMVVQRICVSGSVAFRQTETSAGSVRQIWASSDLLSDSPTPSMCSPRSSCFSARSRSGRCRPTSFPRSTSRSSPSSGNTPG